MAMEDWTIANIRQAIEKGTLKSIVPEQVDLEAMHAYFLVYHGQS